MSIRFKGAKGLLINITGGKDMTLFEVDQSVNKIIAEVDPEDELIFGAIKDENMDGKMRVSIVATSLDGHKPESKTILNMVNRIQNRNTGYSEKIFSSANNEPNLVSSIDGATALKLDEQIEIKVSDDKNQSALIDQKTEESNNDNFNLDANGLSIENASYIEENLDVNKDKLDTDTEFTPKLFSEDIKQESNNSIEEENFYKSEDENLFEPGVSDDDDFEIPAFLRKQKF